MQARTPRQIVDELDRHIVGQADAKRAVAVAIRNRWRRQSLAPDIARGVTPKNIIMIGPTGVGKTEIARRLADLTGAPFIKVEATKFTEVGYHGRDVESMVRDLVEAGVSLVKAEQAETVRAKAEAVTEDRLMQLLLPTPPRRVLDESPEDADRRTQTRDRLLEQLRSGALDEREVDLTTSSKPTALLGAMGLDQLDPDAAGMLEKMMPSQSKRRRLTVADARQTIFTEEAERLLDNDAVTHEALSRVQEQGIIFLDEIDKIAAGEGGKGGGSGSPDVSRQGVQRDLLPIVEGSAVNTRHGTVHTDHILFVAAGAFHTADVNDLMPELQGRFPIRVRLRPLTEEDFVRILTEPDGALTKQQTALLAAEGLSVEFAPRGVEAIARVAAKANSKLADIGARRLMTVVERVFEQVNFDAPELVAKGETTLKITEKFVKERTAGLLKDEEAMFAL